jgi:hypothetical protein
MNGFRVRSIVIRACKYTQLHAIYDALLFRYHIQRTLQGGVDRSCEELSRMSQ